MDTTFTGRRPSATAKSSASPARAGSLPLPAKEGPAVFYTGAIAQAIHEEMRVKGGMLTKDDLARYTPRVRPPLMGEYRGLELAFSPGATGGITALETLNILAQFPKARTTWKTATGLHLRAEAVGRAFLDRLEHLGDAERVRSPWEGLVSRAYAAKAASGLKPNGPRRRLHHAPLRRGPAAQHGLAYQHGRVAVGLAHGRAGHGHPAPERHDLVRSPAGARQLRCGRQAAAGQHGAGPGLQEGRAPSRGGSAGRAQDHLGHPAGDLEHGGPG